MAFFVSAIACSIVGFFGVETLNLLNADPKNNVAEKIVVSWPQVSEPKASAQDLKRYMKIGAMGSSDFLANLAKDDPEAAAAAAFRTLLSPKALREAASRMKPSVRDAFLSDCAKQLWGLSPQEALAFSEEFTPHELPATAVTEIAANLLQTGGERVSEWMKSLTSEQKAATLSGALSAINFGANSLSTPGVMKAWLDAGKGLDSLKTGDVRWATAIAAKKFDLGTLLNATALVPASERNALEEAIYSSASYELARRDPVALRAQVESAPDELRKGLLSKSVGVLAAVDYKSAMDWRRTTDDPAARAALDYGLIGYGSAEMPITLRKELCLQRIGDKPDWNSLQPAVDRLVRDFATTDPTQAFDILQALPDQRTRDQIVPNFVKNWAELDPVAASEWLVQMPASKTRDLAVKELVAASRDDPEVAVQNAGGHRR